MSSKEIEKHCAEIYKCNQRGGRMLSIIDLVKANTLSMDIAAFLLERVSNGDSFIVGANPGGAGKTTVMCALINCIPGNMQIFHAENLSAIESGKDKNPGCFICHEISRGTYYAYLWARRLQEFFTLKKDEMCHPDHENICFTCYCKHMVTIRYEKGYSDGTKHAYGQVLTCCFLIVALLLMCALIIPLLA